jgi:hypothetical protein
MVFKEIIAIYIYIYIYVCVCVCVCVCVAGSYEAYRNSVCQNAVFLNVTAGGIQLPLGIKRLNYRTIQRFLSVTKHIIQ